MYKEIIGSHKWKGGSLNFKDKENIIINVIKLLKMKILLIINEKIIKNEAIIWIKK